MSTDDVPVSSLVTQAEVAGTRSLLIPGGDAVPSTHTALTPAPARKVSPIPPSRAPHSFAASPPRSRTALIPWWSLLLSGLALAALGAVTAITELPAFVGAATAVALAGCCLVLVVAELVHRVTTVRGRL
jgi:hypothetical protein